MLKQKAGCTLVILLLGCIAAIWLGVTGHSNKPTASGPKPPISSDTNYPGAVPATPTGPVRGARTVTAKVVGVHDGDTITLLTAEHEQIKIRFEAIDAPETSQEYISKAKEALSDLVFGRTVEARISKQDRYGRSLAWISADGIDVNRRMVADGWAWRYVAYNHDPDIAALQEHAKAARLGLWAATRPPMPPWEFRAFGKAKAAEKKAGTAAADETATTDEPKSEKPGAGAKYWINSNGVRHNRSCRWYGDTQGGHYSDEPEGTACGKCGG